MSQTNSNGASIVLAGLIGGLIGVAVGLMLAPKPGKELRRDFATEGKEILNDMRQVFEEVRGENERITEDISSGSPEAENIGKLLIR